MKILIGDQVKVMVGKDRGKTGLVTRVLPKSNLVYVAGVNQTVRHVKPNVNKSGERKVIFKPIDVCKVAIINNKGEIDRVGYKVDKQGDKTRFFKKTGVEITTETAKSTPKTKLKIAPPEKPKKSVGKSKSV
ncbi:MAG: 50S ribosomal protein L24 [Patescibacteria group bacterium]|nr:50S ribosomal protein L24 [Patescibacteria group bacterium]